MNKKHKIWQSHIPGCALGAKVVNIKQRDRKDPSKFRSIPDVAFAIRFWKRAVKDSGVLEEYKGRKHFIKKSEKRRVQLENAKYLQWVSDLNNQ